MSHLNKTFSILISGPKFCTEIHRSLPPSFFKSKLCTCFYEFHVQIMVLLTLKCLRNVGTEYSSGIRGAVFGLVVRSEERDELSLLRA